MPCRLVAFLSVLIASCWFAASGVKRTYCNSEWMTVSFFCFWMGGHVDSTRLPLKKQSPEFSSFDDIFQTIFQTISSFWRQYSRDFRSICIPYFQCFCPIFGSNPQPWWGLAERPSLQRKLVANDGIGGSGSLTIIEHGVARDVAAQRDRRCPEQAALRTVLLDLGLKDSELTDIRNVEGVKWWYLGSSEMPESRVV